MPEGRLAPGRPSSCGAAPWSCSPTGWSPRDVETFLRRATDALRTGDPTRCAAVAATCSGELLPDALYASWTQDIRRRVHARLAELLRRGGDLERLLEVEPTDEAACRELMRAAIDAGQRHAAIRWYERLRIALIRELGARPDAETRALYDRCTSGLRLGEPVFVGRELELAAVMGELGRVAGGGTAAVVVRGTIGIGKSALCREVVRRAADGRWRVLTTTSTASGPPYGPIAAAIEQLLLGGRAALKALPGRTRSVLAELTPLAEPAPSLAGPLTRHQVVAALRRALALAQDRPPTLLVVEDAHLADEATADVLHQLVAAAGSPLVVLLACRAEWIRTSLPRGIARLERSEQSRLLELGPLTIGEVAQLIQATGDPADRGPAPEVAKRIVRTAEGSPFFALELARASSSATAGGALPRTVREAITERFVGFDAAALDALAKLAVVDGELDLESVLALTGLAEDAAFVMLDEALGAGVLVVTGTRYRFRHELVRQALTESMSPHRRLALHRAAARRLEAAGGTPELVAHHLLAGNRAEEAVPWLLDVVRHAVELGAFADALGQVERLLLHAPRHHDGLRLRAEVLDALGDGRAPAAYASAAAVIGEPEAQELTARRALAQLKASEPASALRTLEGCTPRTVVGRLAEALTLSASRAVTRLPADDLLAARACHPRLRRPTLRHRADAVRRPTQRRDHRLRRRVGRGGRAPRRRSWSCLRPHTARRGREPRGPPRAGRRGFRRWRPHARADRRSRRRGAVAARPRAGCDVERTARARTAVSRRCAAARARERGRSPYAGPNIWRHGRGCARSRSRSRACRRSRDSDRRSRRDVPDVPNRVRRPGRHRRGARG